MDRGASGPAAAGRSQTVRKSSAFSTQRSRCALRHARSSFGHTLGIGFGRQAGGGPPAVRRVQLTATFNHPCRGAGENAFRLVAGLPRSQNHSMPQERQPGISGVPASPVFATTHWSVVLAAGQEESSVAATALEQLCRTYWYPLYAYL